MDGHSATQRSDDSSLMELLAPPRRATVLVIDVQNDFCADEGWFGRIGHDLTAIQAAVRRLSEFLPAAREVGIPVCYVQAIYDEKYLSAAMRRRHGRGDLPIEHCQSNTWGADFYGPRPLADDSLITKHRYSAFIDTELNALLRAQNVDTLLFTGITSNVCVESTARDGFMLDYDVVLLSDCTATYSQELHEATIENIGRSFGVVATAEEVSVVWNRHGLESESDADTSTARH